MDDAAPTTVTLHRLRIPLLAPHVAAHGTEAVREVILVALGDGEGLVGWGECPTLSRPGYSAEWTDGAWRVLAEVLAPAVLGGAADPGSPDHPMASGAIRDAWADLRLRRAGQGPEALLGPLAEAVPFGVAVAVAPGRVGDTLAAVDRAVAAGAGLVVLKVRPRWSVAPLRAVRTSHPDLAVAVDGNGSFTEADRDELRAIDRCEPVFFEQPLPPGDLEGSARVAAAMGTPVALDEGISGPGDLDAAVAAGAGSILTAKPARVGGVEAAAVLVPRAAAAGWGAHGGGMLESGVGRAAARLVAALPAVEGPALVGPTALLAADDVVGPAPVSAPGTVAVHRGPGLVPPPDPDRLVRLTVDRWSLG